MPRRASSQWDFGELFPPQTARRVWSVTEITSRVKRLLEQQVGEVWVSGEISNLRVQSSGHSYFTLKDPGAQLQCVLFRGAGATARAALRDGLKVVLQGDVTVYEPRGQYQLIVRTVELQGVGALQAAFERLKQKLAAEGLFDETRKRPIPRLPRRIGVVTSPTGAALQDVLHVLERRYAGLELILAPCRVQGTGAEQEIAAAITALNAFSAATPASRLDVILLTRGGGSLEDLWAFNEEAVARAIAASAVPVVSAVGHEIDFTIADFVADLRAATPSAAAELLTAGYLESREAVPRLQQRLRRAVNQPVGAGREALVGLSRRLGRAHPRRWLDDRLQRLDDLQTALARRGRDLLRMQRQALQAAVARLAALRPRRRLREDRERAAALAAALGQGARAVVSEAARRVDRLSTRLDLLSPVNVLARGYSITLDAQTGRVLRQADETAPGRRLRTRLHSGEVTSVVIPAGPPPATGGPAGNST
jgi:exodeoxyribonuclease VII large subunit